MTARLLAALAGHLLPRLQGSKAFDLEGGNAYRRGVFAPACVIMAASSSSPSRQR